ncbi:hypothetical protein HanIR_Chr15g0775031 [Helianthus annuus]|nr:hypothetical protein HanIR_Chr15g0775031 [Helianthus annuus]
MMTDSCGLKGELLLNLVIIPNFSVLLVLTSDYYLLFKFAYFDFFFKCMNFDIIILFCKREFHGLMDLTVLLRAVSLPFSR